MAGIQLRFLITVALSVLIAAASAWLALGSTGLDCNRLPSLTICATLAAFVIALSFRQMSKASGKMQKSLLAIALFIAGTTLFSDARFVLKYRGLCTQLQQQMQSN
jgi:hypothetical protein